MFLVIKNKNEVLPIKNAEIVFCLKLFSSEKIVSNEVKVIKKQSPIIRR